jgi:transposase|tara:strand:+ start:110 stop:1135 length:1026 start_codon:yes stop_codon:yes gene_type:complete
MTLVAINDNGKLLTEEKLTTTPANLSRFFESFTEPVQAVVECTSYWYWVADWCDVNGVPLTLAHAKMLKAISYAKVKTDSVDARTLAELLRVDLIPEAHQCRRNQRDLRELTRGRLRMIERRSSLQSSLWQLAAKYNVIVQDVGWRYLGKLAEFLQQQLPPVAWVEAELLLEQIRLTQNQIVTLEEAIEEQTGFHKEVERLKALPGFGLVCAWTVVAEIGDISRFPSAKQFVSYCRLVPGARDSGGKHRHRSKNKDGNRYLRITFNQAAIIANRDYPVVKEFYNKVRRRSGKHVARTVVGKELAKIVWHMLSKEEEYKGFKGRMTRITTQNYWPQPISPNA